MKVYQTKAGVTPGSDFRELNRRSKAIYNTYISSNRRQPYIRSAYFKKNKVFLSYFWQHLWQTNWRDRVRRLRYLEAGLELIVNSRFAPLSKPNPNKRHETLYRFAGITKDGELFFVQIKEDAKTGRKYLMSVFPEDT